jgi:competence protein ComEC
LLLIGGGLARRFESATARAIAVGAGAELATTPLTAVFFNQVVLGSSLITLLLSPLLSLMVVLAAGACGLAFAAPSAAVLVLESIGRLDAIAVAANVAIADTTGAARFVAAPPAWIVSGAFLLALAAILRFERGAAIAALVLLLPPLSSVWIERSRRAVDAFEMTLVDVGQGEAILLRRGTESVLVDGGGRRGDPAFGRRVIAPFLVDHGVRRPKVVVMTHPDPDHCAGLVSVVELLGADEVWLSSRHAREPCATRLLDAAQRRRIAVRLVDRHPPRVAGSLPVRVFAAEPPFRKSFANNTSLTIALEAGGSRILLTGDVEKPAEFRLLEAAPAMLACDVLKVAHHGSSSSTAAAFLRTARPRIAAISCGRENSYGHPAAEVVQRLERAGARIYRTDRDGTTTFVLREGRIFVAPQIDTGVGAGSL